MDHALSCSQGGYPSLRHNELRDLTAQRLSETCPNVSTKLELQPLKGVGKGGAGGGLQPPQDFKPCYFTANER